MSFLKFELSRYLGKPVDLFRVQYGPNAADVYRYTDAERPITTGGETFEPHQISRDKITASGTLDKANVEVYTNRSSPLFELFRAGVPNHVVTIEIYQGHVDDPERDFRRIWVGKMINFGLAKGGRVTFTCEPTGTLVRRNGLRRNWQIGCPHVLYRQGEGQCNANIVRATKTVTVESISGVRINLTAAIPGLTAANAVKFFSGGQAYWLDNRGAQDRRTIVAVSSDARAITVSGANLTLAPGRQISIVYGCPRSMDGCATIHDNIVNYGGMPWIPTQNPFGTTNRFY